VTEHDYGADAQTASRPTTGAPILTSHTSVATDCSSRYLKQLLSHLGRHLPFEQTQDSTVLHLGEARCLLVGQTTAISLTATAPNEDSLARIEDVVGRHLVWFVAGHDAQGPSWNRTVSPTG
jgi:uncharacterized protein